MSVQLRRGLLSNILLVIVLIYPLSLTASDETGNHQGDVTSEEEPGLKSDLSRLEDEVSQLKQQLTKLKADLLSASDREKNQHSLAEKKKVQSAECYWKNDFYFSTPDERFWMKARGNFHFDTKFYSSQSHTPMHFDIRRARIDFQGCWDHYITFRVQAEMADSPYIRNAWADFKIRNWLHLRVGQMKPPFSTSWWTMDNQVNFLERGASTPLYPYFDRGWWIWGELFKQRLVYNVAVFTGVGMDYDYTKGDIDDGKDWVTRIFLSPFTQSRIDLLKGIFLCVQSSRGQQSIPTSRFETRGYGAAIRDLKFWTWETENSGSGEIEERNRWGIEGHYLFGPFSFSSEYLVCRYEDISVYAPDGTRVISEDGEITSWSTWFSFFLTGESKKVSNFGWRQPAPEHEFFGPTFTGTGAWEVLFRYTRTETSPELFQTTVYNNEDYLILKGSELVNEYAVGVNWTWNTMVRWQLDYVYLENEEDQKTIRTGDSKNKEGLGYLRKEEMIGLRLMFKF